MPRARDIARSALTWAGFAGVVLVGVPPMVLGYPLVLVDPNRAISDWYFRRIARVLMGVNPFWTVHVEGKQLLARGGPYVLVVNHQSFADLMAMCFLDHPTKYLGKQSVFKVPVFGWALRIAGEVPVVRGNRRSGAEALDRLGDWLDRGVSVALFPEGTRSDDGSIGRFKLGAFRLAIEHGRPVVPVVIAGARELLPKHSLVFQERADIRVRVLEPESTDGLGERHTLELAERVRARMVAALADMEPC
ncbi:MAG: 1-acyl-sn-glycerol-3-phosphate acyltransferase [Polyangiaceae bacterium]|nr:1-acyl-sn-glycerol-3-phosphate acyltransferase [Polyangiaceae bacterium]MCL4750079.1 1-acyl-sn-glycerol-3-phosphate acyltransferase [Myxococcales bacterium]